MSVLLVGALAASEDDNGIVGPLALLIVVLLGVATVLLIRSMNGHLKRLPTTFRDQSAAPDEDDDPPRP